MRARQRQRRRAQAMGLIFATASLSPGLDPTAMEASAVVAPSPNPAESASSITSPATKVDPDVNVPRPFTSVVAG